MFWKSKKEKLQEKLDNEIQKLTEQIKSNYKKWVKEKYKFGDVIEGNIFITSNVQANFVYYCYNENNDSLEYVSFNEDKIREQVLQEIEELKKDLPQLK